jgi:hypothetical protein
MGWGQSPRCNLTHYRLEGYAVRENDATWIIIQAAAISDMIALHEWR